MVFRLSRSIHTPAMGPMSTWGRSPTMLAMVRSIAELVLTVIHQMMANWTALDESRENACPV